MGYGVWCMPVVSVDWPKGDRRARVTQHRTIEKGEQTDEWRHAVGGALGGWVVECVRCCLFVVFLYSFFVSFFSSFFLFVPCRLALVYFCPQSVRVSDDGLTQPNETANNRQQQGEGRKEIGDYIHTGSRWYGTMKRVE